MKNQCCVYLSAEEKNYSHYSTLLFDYLTVTPEYKVSNTCAWGTRCQHLLHSNRLPRFRSSVEKRTRRTSKLGGNEGGD